MRGRFMRRLKIMYVSGGMTLIPSMKQRLAAPSDLIDLSSLSELQGAQLNDAHGATLRVGGLTRHNEVADSALIHQHMPVLGQVAAAIGDNQVRNRGTLGGSIANADPAADLPAALLAMKAVVNTQDRQTPADEFFLDLFETALDAGDIVVSVDFSPPLQAVYEKVSPSGVRVCSGWCPGCALRRWRARWCDWGRSLRISRVRDGRSFEPRVSSASR